MTTYDVYLRDRKDPITVEADHMEVDRVNGVPVGFDFVKQNPAHSNVSIQPVRVLYAPAERVDAITPRETGATPPPPGREASIGKSIMDELGDDIVKLLRDLKKR